MSTDLKPVKVKTRKDLPLGKFEMLDTEIHLTAFYGGQVRGRSIQLGINNGVSHFDGWAYCHLTVDQAIELRKRLDQFIEKEY